ncbi:MAG: phage integrase N-terminal SAM-like domain-containing protein [Candidatus Tectomicrobia bacterium]|uniref:Phage integrase N-terminal SAM-like domain-containing protein n=1 Tax=Tectimicrobiota bacterium TaxID=2528274 RepID=A0A932GPR2_UNCTE|nr:phage integrase N-terminal SAM-like domain-containing protein [Candidatus Tectomicrobia bacterium]
MVASGSSHFHPTTVSPRGRQPKPLDQVRQAIRTRHYSYRTEKAYVHWIKRFIFFHNKRYPAEMGEAEIGQFLASRKYPPPLPLSGETGTNCESLLIEGSEKLRIPPPREIVSQSAVRPSTSSGRTVK